MRRHPISTLFPYTTLFRSVPAERSAKRTDWGSRAPSCCCGRVRVQGRIQQQLGALDRKSTRLNSSHVKISYAVFCLKKKNGLNQHRSSVLERSLNHPRVAG